MLYTIVAAAAMGAAVVKASPFPQGVIAAISPPAPAPPGCTGSRDGEFGIALMNVDDGSAGPVKRQEMPDASGSPPASVFTMAPVSQIGDGQVQAGTQSITTTISDTASNMDDGQAQNVCATATETAACGAEAPAMTVTVSVTDQEMTATQSPSEQDDAVTVTVTDQEMTATQSPSEQDDGMLMQTARPVPQLPDNQAPFPNSSVVYTSPSFPSMSMSMSINMDMDMGMDTGNTKNSTSTHSDGHSDGHSDSDSNPTLVARRNPSTLSLRLANGILTDNQGRTGYIASNRQYQFDAPPQSGAIYTAGFSVCHDQDDHDGGDSLALGGSKIFYQCRSGDFSNIYDRDWAEQCSPVTIRIVEFSR